MHVLSILAAESESSGGAAVALQFGFFLLIPIAMYFLLIKPQRRRQKTQAAMQSSIDVGDEVMTTSGLYGFITGFDGDIVWLEIDDNVQIRVARAAVQRKVDTDGSRAEAPTHDDSKRGSQIEPAENTGDSADQ
jgi:preprotein translocase subunit YajC